MKSLFYILVALNIIVFAGMIGSKTLKQHLPAVQQASQPQQTIVSPPPIIINTADLQNQGNGSYTVTPQGNGQTVQIKPNRQPAANNANKPAAANNNARNNSRNSHASNGGAVRSISAQGDAPERHSPPRVQYKACSARVSIPENDYHRIKGLLRKYPHAASRQVVQGGGEGNSQSSSRMNVLFMSVNDQEAGAIQGVVGRYGQLSRTPCDR